MNTRAEDLCLKAAASLSPRRGVHSHKENISVVLCGAIGKLGSQQEPGPAVRGRNE